MDCTEDESWRVHFVGVGEKIRAPRGGRVGYFCRHFTIKLPEDQPRSSNMVHVGFDYVQRAMSSAVQRSVVSVVRGMRGAVL